MGTNEAVGIRNSDFLTTKHTKHTKSEIVDFGDECRTQNLNLRIQILGFLVLRALCELL